MTYNVFGGTLSLTQSINHSKDVLCICITKINGIDQRFLKFEHYRQMHICRWQQREFD